MVLIRPALLREPLRPRRASSAIPWISLTVIPSCLARFSNVSGVSPEVGKRDEITVDSIVPRVLIAFSTFMAAALSWEPDLRAVAPDPDLSSLEVVVRSS